MTASVASFAEYDASEDRVRLARAFFPDLAAELDRALALHGNEPHDDLDALIDAHLRAGGVSSGVGRGVSAADEGAENPSRAELAAEGFVGIADAATGDRLRQAFIRTRTVVGWIGLGLPEPEAFAAAGVDLPRLGSALTASSTAGTELAPVIAPYGIGSAGWYGLFECAEQRGLLGKEAAADPAPDADAPPRTPEPPLRIAAEALREFALLDRAPNPETPVVTEAGVAWTLRLVPASPAPPVVGLSYEHGPHASLPEILMLQLTRSVAGEPPLDTASFTWLAGPLAGGRLAARHVYDTSERVVRVNCREVGNQGPHLGSRRPVG
ncbi:MAG: hypothetical protein ACK5LO_06150 [Leucobacter sp.]